MAGMNLLIRDLVTLEDGVSCQMLRQADGRAVDSCLAAISVVYTEKEKKRTDVILSGDMNLSRFITTQPKSLWDFLTKSRSFEFQQDCQ